VYYTVDRIEGGFAMLEDANMNMKNVKLNDLPENIKEGDILKLENNIYIIDTERTKRIKKELDERLRKMFKN